MDKEQILKRLRVLMNTWDDDEVVDFAYAAHELIDAILEAENG